MANRIAAAIKQLLDVIEEWLGGSDRCTIQSREGLFGLAALGRLEEKHLLLHDGVVLEHAERAVHARPDHRAVVARQSHGDQAHGDGAGFRWRFALAVQTCGFGVGGAGSDCCMVWAIQGN